VQQELNLKYCGVAITYDFLPLFAPRKNSLNFTFIPELFCLSRYSILAPNVIPPGFVDSKLASETIMVALNHGDNYRIGHTKVFFKAGILGQLEQMREEKLSKILSSFQAHIRGYMVRKGYTTLEDQRYTQ